MRLPSLGLAVALCVASASSVAADAPTKTLYLNRKIMPNWEQLGGSEATQKIRLERVAKYWEAREVRDKRVVASLFDDPSEALAAVDAFYDSARNCLRRQRPHGRHDRIYTEIALVDIELCIITNAGTPQFTVATSVNWPSEYFQDVAVDYADDEDEDAETQAQPEAFYPHGEADDFVTLPPGLQATTNYNPGTSSGNTPLSTYNEEMYRGSSYKDQPGSSYNGVSGSSYNGVSGSSYIGVSGSSYNGVSGSSYNGVSGSSYNGMSGSSYKDQPGPPFNGMTASSNNELPGSSYKGYPGSSYQEMPEPSYKDHPGPAYDDVPSFDTAKLEPSPWPFSPLSPSFPPFWAIDLDRNDFVDVSELRAYVQRLYSMAMQTVQRGERDPVAVKLLRDIVGYHYHELDTCIQNKLGEDKRNELNRIQFSVLSAWIVDNCDVKFHYSLLAGPPPFEWIAKDKPTVSAATIEAWFSWRVEAARRAVSGLRVAPQQAQVLEKFVACTYSSLRSAGSTPIPRNVFYEALAKIEECAHQE